MYKLNITSTVLDKLGFSEYCDEHGTWGTRTLTFNNGCKFRIIEQEEMDDCYEGNWLGGEYVANHYYFGGFMAIPKIECPMGDLFFLHEMYDVIKIYYPTCIDEFIEKCKYLKMYKFLNINEDNISINNFDKNEVILKINDYIKEFSIENLNRALEIILNIKNN